MDIKELAAIERARIREFMQIKRESMRPAGRLKSFYWSIFRVFQIGFLALAFLIILFALIFQIKVTLALFLVAGFSLVIASVVFLPLANSSTIKMRETDPHRSRKLK
jgi:hypothetical protein